MTTHEIQRFAPRGYKVFKLSEQLGPKRVVSWRARPTKVCSGCGRDCALGTISGRHEYP